MRKAKNPHNHDLNFYLSLLEEERAFKVSKATFNSDKTRINNVKKLLAQKSLNEIIHSDIRQIILKMHKSGYKNKTLTSTCR